MLKAELERAKAELAAADDLPPPHDGGDLPPSRNARSESDVRRRGAHVGRHVEPGGAAPAASEWVAGTDPTSGHPYWYNTQTQQSQWTNPHAHSVGAAAPQPPAGGAGPFTDRR